MIFVTPGEKASKSPNSDGIIAKATDWQMMVDLGRRLQFPPRRGHTYITKVGHWDTVSGFKAGGDYKIYSSMERIENANETKRSKYDELKLNVSAQDE